MTETPFPFPHDQMAVLALLIFCLVSAPVVICSSVGSTFWSACLSAIVTFFFHGTHEVARELEDPFTSRPNEITNLAAVIPMASQRGHFALAAADDIVEQTKQAWRFCVL